MKSTTDITVSSLNAETNSYVQLIKVELISGEEYRFCSDNSEQTFRGEVYSPLGGQVELGRFSENEHSEIDSTSVTLGNPDGIFTKSAVNGELENASVSVWISSRNALGTLDGIAFYSGVISSVSTTESLCSLSISPNITRFNDATGRKFQPTCAWTFKSTECGYSGAETSCNKTLQQCLARSNSDRFGGFDIEPSAGG